MRIYGCVGTQCLLLQHEVRGTYTAAMMEGARGVCSLMTTLGMNAATVDVKVLGGPERWISAKLWESVRRYTV